MVRLKRRYLVLELQFADQAVNDSANAGAINAAVKSSVKTLYGDYGISSLGSFSVKYSNASTNIVLMQCYREFHRNLMHAITFVKSIEQRSCLFRLLYKAGTMKSCQKFLLHHNEKMAIEGK